MSDVDTEPGHEDELHPGDLTMLYGYDRRLFSAEVELEWINDVHPRFPSRAWWTSPARRDLFEWWYAYRAGLLTRSALADLLTPLQRVRLTIELFGVTLLAALFWTAVVFAGLVLISAFL